MTERWKHRLAWIVLVVIAADWWTKFTAGGMLLLFAMLRTPGAANGSHA